jgi:hypothetical protein
VLQVCRTSTEELLALHCGRMVPPGLGPSLTAPRIQRSGVGGGGSETVSIIRGEVDSIVRWHEHVTVLYTESSLLIAGCIRMFTTCKMLINVHNWNVPVTFILISKSEFFVLRDAGTDVNFDRTPPYHYLNLSLSHLPSAKLFSIVSESAKFYLHISFQVFI